jgi:hypothetical protein
MTDEVVYNYALVKNEIVTNIVAISTLTPELELSILADNDDLIKIDEADLWYVSVGSTWDGENFFPVDTTKPYSSWSWDAVNKTWKSPVPKPPFDINTMVTYEWNESVLEWEPI